MKRSQVSVEFLIAIGLFLILFSFITALTMEKKGEVRDAENYLEKKSECLRVANKLSSISNLGDGTKINLTTFNLLSIYNRSVIGVRSVRNLSEEITLVAVLVSEAGETTQVFYDNVQNKLEPDWYKTCFSDIGPWGFREGCNTSDSDVDYLLIPNNLSSLIERINDYKVIYLEDSTIQYNAEFGGKTYLEILEEWVRRGGSIILSEHVMCRERSWSSYPSTSYRCNPPGFMNDIWRVFGHNLHQDGGSYGNDVTVIIEPNIELFPTLKKDDTFDFEEESYVKQISIFQPLREEAERFRFTGGYRGSDEIEDPGFCLCGSPSASGCMRHEGSILTPANATWRSDLAGNYDITISYCGESDGDDQWWIYKDGLEIDNWVTSSQSSWQERTIKNVALNYGTELKLSCDRGTGSSYCRADYLELVLLTPGENEAADSGIFKKNSVGNTRNEGSLIETFEEDCPGSGNSRQCSSSNSWEIGYVDGSQYATVDFNATFTFNLSDLGINSSDITSFSLDWGGCWNGGSTWPPSYCDNGDDPEFRTGTNGNFEVLIFNGNNFTRLDCNSSFCELNDTLLLGGHNTPPPWNGNSDAYNKFTYKNATPLTENHFQDGIFTIRFHTWGTNHQNNYEVWQEIDYVKLSLGYQGKSYPSSEPLFEVIGTYDDDNRTAIVYWQYGAGKVFYFGDFQVELMQEEYSQMIGDLIGIVKLLYFLPKSDEMLCNYLGNVVTPGEFIGNIQVVNINGEIRINSTGLS